MANFADKVALLWDVANLIRDTFKRGHYQDVILPLTVLRRIDCVLQPTRANVLQVNAHLKGRLDNLDPQLRHASGYAFYNTSAYDFEHLLADPPHIAANLRNYIAGFSENMREVIERFDFDNTISKLDSAGLLFLVLERFKNVDLHPDRVSNQEMGHIFEELIRRFNEALDENPGEHFTPREVIRLMVGLLLAQDHVGLRHEHIVRTVYDPCCGSGGMLTSAKDRIHEISPSAEVYLFGQEVNPETFAVCKSDLYMKSADGQDAEQIAFGSVLARDQHAGRRFDYLLANPPYGKDWRMDQAAVDGEHARGDAGRFGAGLPRISDGQLLFLQHMLARMKPPEVGGSRVAIVMNGSPLFTGDAGSGESEIRRWILEHDWLDAIVALPEQLFYNTGIATYVWILTNRKQPARRGKVQLIDATSHWVPMRKSLGEKRREISEEQIAAIRDTYLAFAESDQSKIFATTDFGARKITIERPLRLNFRASPERIVRLDAQRAFADLGTSKPAKARKNGSSRDGEAQPQPLFPAPPEAVNDNGLRMQSTIRATLASLPDTLYTDRPAFERALSDALEHMGSPRLPAPLSKAVLAALGERDAQSEICRDASGQPEPDPDLRDSENVPLAEDIYAYFDREVRTHVPDAWINTSVRDERDGQVGRVGYEINFNRYFYRYQPPRPLGAIEADIRALETEILTLLREVAG